MFNESGVVTAIGGRKEVQPAGHAVANRPGRCVGQGHGDGKGRRSERQNQHDVHAEDLARLCAGGFHDADLAHLLGHERGNRIHDQKAAQQHSHPAQDGQDGEHALRNAVGEVVTRLVYPHIVHGRAGPLDAVGHVLCHFCDVRGVRGALRDANGQLVVVAAASEPLHGVRVYKCIDGLRQVVREAGGIMQISGHAQVAPLAVGQFDLQDVAGLVPQGGGSGVNQNFLV